MEFLFSIEWLRQPLSVYYRGSVQKLGNNEGVNSLKKNKREGAKIPMVALKPEEKEKLCQSVSCHRGILIVN